MFSTQTKPCAYEYKKGLIRDLLSKYSDKHKIEIGWIKITTFREKNLTLKGPKRKRK